MTPAPPAPQPEGSWFGDFGRHSRSAPAGFALPLLGVPLAYLLTRTLGMTELPGPPFMAVIALSAWYGGGLPGLLATALSALTIDYFYVTPYHSFRLVYSADAIQLVAFVTTGIIVSMLSHALIRNRRRAEHESRENTQLRVLAEKAAKAAAEAAETVRQASLRAELAAQQQEKTAAMLDTMLGSTPIGLGFLDRDLKFVRVNRVLADIYGLRPEQCLGRTLVEALPDEAPTLAPLCRSIFDTGRPILHQECRRETGSGAPSHYLRNLHPVRTPEGVIGWIGLSLMDITERKRMESELRESAEHLEDFFENACIGLHWVGPDGTVLRVNQTELSLLGYTKEEVVGRHIREFHADSDIINDILTRLGSDETLVHYPARLRHKDGSIRHVLIDSSVLWKEGRFIHTRCFTRDVTAQRLAEEQRLRAVEELRQSEARLRMALEAGRLGTFEWDIASGRLGWSEELQRLHGYEPGTFSGTIDAFTNEIHPEDRQRITHQIEQILSGNGAHHVEYRIVRGDGSIRWVEGKGMVLRDDSGLPIRVTGVCADITERKLAEDAYRLAQESQVRLAAIVESSSDAIVGKTLTGIVTSWNQGAEQLFGYSAEEMIGQSIYRVIPPELHAEEGRILEQVLRGERVEHYEAERVRKDGKRIVIELTVSPIRDAGGKVVGAASIKRDITERRLIAQQLRNHAAELEQRVAERTADLEARAAELARSNAELEQFAYIASHDLQEPLRMVTNFTQLLQRRYRGKLDRDADDFIGYAVRGVERMHALITGLLTYSRVRDQALILEPISLERVVREAWEHLAPTATETHASIFVEPLPTVLVDATQMLQVFQNLLGNALKFRQSEVPPRLRLWAERRVAAGRPEWIISVQDNGIGIAPQYGERIFVIFQRLHAQSHYEGTGIGLAICQKVVERHGGRIWVEPVTEGGSIFRFTLPVASEPAPGTHAERRPGELVQV